MALCLGTLSVGFSPFSVFLLLARDKQAKLGASDCIRSGAGDERA